MKKTFTGTASFSEGRTQFGQMHATSRQQRTTANTANNHDASTDEAAYPDSGQQRQHANIVTTA